MNNKYYEVIAQIDGETEVLFGSFDRVDCVDEIEAERETWKGQGYKKFKITSREINDAPDADVYADIIVSSHELFIQQAPSLNFECNESELLALAIERGFVTKIEGRDDAYLINREYEGV